MRVQCSSCDAEIDAEAPRCPVCLSERTRAEIFQGLRGEDPRSTRRRSGALLGAFWVLLGIVGTAAGLRWQLLERAKQRREAQARKAEARAQEARWEAEGAGARRGTPAEPAPSAPEGAPNAPASRKPPADSHWTFRGEVYDLKTLEPVSSARLIFKEEGAGKAFEAVTDARGGYSIRLAKDKAPYSLKILHPRYRGDFVEDDSPSYRLQSAARRLDALAGFQAVPVLHVPLSPPVEEDSAEASFAMIAAHL